MAVLQLVGLAVPNGTSRGQCSSGSHRRLRTCLHRQEDLEHWVALESELETEHSVVAHMIAVAAGYLDSDHCTASHYSPHLRHHGMSGSSPPVQMLVPAKRD